jgi:hypothetical protein
MSKRGRWTALAFWLAIAGAAAQPAGPAADPPVRPAIDGILAAFQDHPLVGLGDYHDVAQEEDFYAALVRDPRFAREVGNIVVEFGSASSQDIADRYLAGETVPHAELRKIWTDRVSWVPGGARLGYINFFAQVRAVNLGLPPNQRIRVLLGDPPIDWSKIHTKTDWLPILRQRDTHTAALIEREILARNKKALVIFGGTHFFASPGGGSLGNLGPLIQQAHPGAIFVVSPYAGFNEKACSVRFEDALHNWPLPALATPVRGTKLEAMLRASGCHAAPPGRAAEDDIFSGVAGDALLYLGPASSLMYAPMQPDIYLDADYRAEISRRYEIIMGKPLVSSTVESNPATLRPLRN